jgi:hypothetical protein
MKFTEYSSLSSADADDVLLIVDVDDTSMALSGTTKKITAGNLVPSNAGGAAVFMANAVTTNYAATSDDFLIEGNATGGAITVFLPTDDSLPAGQIIIVKKTDSSGNAVSFGPDTGTIDGYGSAAIPLAAQWDWAAVIWDGSRWTQIAGNVIASGLVVSGGGNTDSLVVDTSGNVQVGNGALGTTATNGFLYIPTCAGAPTGTPTAKTGLVPMVYDTTDHKFWIYNGAWKGTVLS